jgi:hypothetical protein
MGTTISEEPAAFIFKLTSTMMNEAGFSKIKVTIYQTTPRHIPQYHDLNTHCYKNLISHRWQLFICSQQQMRNLGVDTL